MHEPPVNVVQVEPAVSNADHEVLAVGQRRDAVNGAAHLKGALETAFECPELDGVVNGPADEARSAQHHYHSTHSFCVRLNGAHAHAIAPQIDGTVERAGDNMIIGCSRNFPDVTGVPGERHNFPRERPRLERELCGVAERAARQPRERDVVGER